MKKLLIVLLAALPAGAQAMEMHGGMYGGMRHMPPPIGMHFAAALYALLAALGYWVLQHAAKETENCVKRAGKLVAWVLIVVGLLGLLCGVVSHVRMAARCCGKCAVPEASQPTGAPGWHEAQGAAASGPAQPPAKAEKAAPKGK